MLHGPCTFLRLVPSCWCLPPSPTLQVYDDALLVFNNARTYNKLPTEDVHYMANRVQVGTGLGEGI